LELGRNRENGGLETLNVMNIKGMHIVLEKSPLSVIF
jgi:hypothetical protein